MKIISLFKLKIVKIFVLILITTVPIEIYSQNEEGTNTWMINQRKFPQDSIPQDALYNAMLQQVQKRNQSGYYLSTFQWTSIGPTVTGARAGRITSENMTQ
jgi:hypothetical protein